VQNVVPLLLSQLAPQVPTYLAWLAGMVVALVTWRRHPMVSLLTLLALALFAVLSLGGTLVFAWVVNQPISDAERGGVLTAWGIVRSALAMVGWVLLLVALFGWRRPPAPLPPLPPLGEEPTDEEPHPGIRKGRSWGDG
jgi:hypothetical protein